MGMTNAERQRRYRERKRAEQRESGGGVTSPVTPAVTRNAVTADGPTAPELGARGSRLWREIADEGGELQPGERVLLEEACRIADRLDRLDAILSGSAEDWLSFVETKGLPDRQEIVIDKPLAEARQQATALKQLLAELRQSRVAAGGKPAGRGAGKPAAKSTGGADGGGGGGIVDLVAEAAKRRPNAAG